MKKFVSLVAVLSILSAAIIGTNGRDCYVCYHAILNGTVVDGSDISCELGASPQSHLLRECNSSTAAGILSRNPGGELVFRKRVPELVLPHQEEDVVWGCTTVHADGKMFSSRVETMVRYCLGYIEALTEECQTKPLEEWLVNATTDPISELVSEFAGAYDLNTNVDGCYCNKDRCNGKAGDGDHF